MGHLVTILDLTTFPDIDCSELFARYDMIFSFDIIGIELYNRMNPKPFLWTFLIDPPIYLDERLKQINGDVMVSCIDRRHVLYIDKYYKNIPWTCFMPHGGIAGEIPANIPYKDRKYDVVIFGSLQGLKGINEVIASLKKDYDPLLSDIVDSSLLRPDTDLITIVSDSLAKTGIEFDDEMFCEFMYRIRSVDALRRYYKRSLLIKELIKNGISIDIWGTGWDQLTNDLPDSSLLRLHKSVSYEEAKYIMSNSRILVNDMPPYYEGSHERVFAAMQCSAIVATDRSTYLEECFEDDSNILFYNTDDLTTLAHRINLLLNDDIKANHIIENALVSSESHTWFCRAAAMLEITDMIHN